MASDAVSASYETLTQDAMDGNLPTPTTLCKDCSGFGIPFSLNPPDGPRDADLALGIPSDGKAATEAWFTSNPWIKDELKNFRATYLIRVALRVGELFGEAYQAELFAYLKARDIELECMDFMMDDGEVTPFMLGEIARADMVGNVFTSDKHNFVFFDKRIYYWTFTQARFVEDTPTSPEGYRGLAQFAWTTTGRYDVTAAAKQLAANFESRKASDKMWRRVFATGEVVLGVLSIIPQVRVVSGGVTGTYRGVKYCLAAIDAALAANAVISGSQTLITGEGIDYGETMFASLGKLVDPKNGEERGRQVFMFINLAMLTPAALGGARWVVRRIRPDTPTMVRFDVKELPEAERKRLHDRGTAEPLSIELRGNKRASSRDGTGDIEWYERASPDRNASQMGVTTTTGSANYATMVNTMRARLAMLIVQHAGTLRVIGRICKVVGDAGEEAMAAAMVEKMKFKRERILGFSKDPKIPHRFGLTNKSGHGLDMLVWVPPPPSLIVRDPVGAERHLMDGIKGTAPTKTLTFTEDTLLVIETKSTLGGTKTPGFNSTQGTGAGKVTDIQTRIAKKMSGWTPIKMREVDPRYAEKIEAIADAKRSGRIAHIHAQVFFDHQGSLNKLAGDGTGIQFNTW